MSRRRLAPPQPACPSSSCKRSNPVRFGTVLIVIAAVLVYFGFTKHIPFKHGFRLNAVFNNAVNIKSKSPVRIAEWTSAR